MRITLLLLIIALTGHPLYAQLDNRPFYYSLSLDSANHNSVSLHLNTFIFSKNNEYFNEIADGYTLFGYQFQPQVSYQHENKLRLDAGVYLQQDFGNADFSTIAPVLSLKLRLSPQAYLIAGTLQGSLNHGLIEPLYNFERVLNDRLEYGLQYLYTSRKIDLDFWLDWQNAIYPGDSTQEEFFAGASAGFTLSKTPSFQARLPYQMTLWHRGGQIDLSPAPLVSLLNQAIGAELSWWFKGRLQQLQLAPYWVMNSSFNGPFRGIDKGHGLYLNLSADWARFTLMASYWRGQDYLSPFGGLLFPSVSSTVKTPEALEPTRELLLLRGLYTWQCMPELDLLLRLEPHWDLYNQQVEFAGGFYLIYNPSFQLYQQP